MALDIYLGVVALRGTPAQIAAVADPVDVSNASIDVHPAIMGMPD